MWVNVAMLVCICVDEYGDFLFCCYSCSMGGLRYNIYIWKVDYFFAFPFVCKSISKGSKDFVSQKMGKKCFNEVEQIVSEEK